MPVSTPRIVVITRETEYELLLAHHATRGQAEFFLSSRGQSIDGLEARHRRFELTLHQVVTEIPTEWRRNRVRRDELDRFLFEPEDLIIAVGQDGFFSQLHLCSSRYCGRGGTGRAGGKCCQVSGRSASDRRQSRQGLF